SEAAIAASPVLASVVDALANGSFSPDDPTRFAATADALRQRDYFMVNADFDSYAQAQQRVDARWRDPDAWWRSAIENTASVGYFSSDRTIRDYAGEVWKLAPNGRR
ncbi:MAG: glycogen/starch/alpha-glucan phosphorylase, partial [Burkholderiales bacterium]|nr:glycogen/starch/alpha-glucan phosphorylase [Burkholderiales bacterium]